MHLRPLTQVLMALAMAGLPPCAFATESSGPTDSNFWPVHRNNELGYRISYPRDWQLSPAKGPNVRFSVVPPSPPGNCNLVVAANPELATMDQASLNVEVQSLGLDAQDWASYIGAPRANIRLLQSRRTSVGGVAGIVGVLETDIENLQGKFMRKQTVTLMLHRGSIWTLNCGASDFNPANVRARYDHLSPVLSKIIGSFGFLAAAVSSSPTLAESLSSAQIKQIEQIAQNIAVQHNANAAAVTDDMTVSSTATAAGRNVRFENVLRVKKGLPPAKLKEFSDATEGEVVPKACAANAKNLAFDRGLTYTFAYKNTYGEKLAEFTVDQASCRGLSLRTTKMKK
jgi:hypothetical protein